MAFHYTIQDIEPNYMDADTGTGGLVDLERLLPRELHAIVEKYGDRPHFKVDLVYGTRFYQIISVD